MDQTNLAYQYDDIWEEMLDGKIFAMSPRPTINHNRISGNINRIFGNYLKGKRCEAFGDGVDVYLTEKDRVIPDAMIVCNRDIIKRNGIHGTPDLVVEILSPSTATNDKGYKKTLYERCGIKEYWIIDPKSKSIEVYYLNDNQFQLHAIYYSHDNDEVADMTDEEKRQIPTHFSTSIFDDLEISICDVFENVL